MIKDAFIERMSKYTSAASVMEMWNKIERPYTESARHYHNIAHLDALVNELTPYKKAFRNWDTIVFAVAYHDVVYNTMKSNNEEKSADFATQQLRNTTFPALEIERCDQLIRATKLHEAADNESNLFTDADLSILGAPHDAYDHYARQIRREYSIYPDFMYNPGRKKVLSHFLSMPAIFKTKEFADRYEAAARENLQRELSVLTNE